MPAGVLADRYGSKRLVMGCLVGMGGAFLLLSMAQGLLLITGALVLWGAAASVYHPAGLALISKGAVRRGHVFAYHGIAGNLGTALGPLTATVLLLFFDWRTVSMLLALPALAVVPLVRRLRIDEAAALGAALAGGMLSLFSAQILFAVLAALAVTGVGLAVVLRRRTEPAAV